MPFAVADPAAPAPAKALTARRLARAIDAGRDHLADTLRPLRLVRRYREGDPTEADRRRVLAKLVLDTRDEARHLAEGLADGKLSLARWHRRMADLIAAQHAAAAMAALGSTRLPKADADRLRARLDGQLGYLERFRAQVASGEQLLDGTAVARAALYADAAWATGMGARTDRAKDQGARYGRRILGASDHCWQCIAEAEAGWRPIELVLPIGSAICGPLCKCHPQFADAPPSFQELIRENEGHLLA